MKRKVLDTALISLLSGMAPLAFAQQTVKTADASVAPNPGNGSPVTPPAVDCTATGCTADAGLLFELRTRSEDEPVTQGTSVQSSSEALQPDRRLEMRLDTPGVAEEKPGRAIAQGRFAVQVAGGGTVWATEDPTLGRAELSVSAPTIVAFDGHALTHPVPFLARSNYPDFIKRMEIALYRSTDTDLIWPLKKIPMTVGPVPQAEWGGEVPSDLGLRVGDELVYVLRAFDAEGNVDETHPMRLQLVRPEDAERQLTQQRDSLSGASGLALEDDRSQAQRLTAQVFDGNALRYQNIPIHGSRVRVQGSDLPTGQALQINGASYPVDRQNKFVAEYLMPIGRHRFTIDVASPQGGAAGSYTMDVDVSGNYLFGVGLADITVYEHGGSVRGRDLSSTDRDEDILSDGRLAFYLKAKLHGKYLITAQADTRDRPLKDLFDGFTNADPRDIFRRLDADEYYPTYGDDSTTSRDVDTMGHFYLRTDWDKNTALWGNFQTGVTGTEYAQYARSLYGAAVDWRSRAATPDGEPASVLRAFGSQAQTAPGHSEFAGTGGSLYYLHHTDVLPGSDRVVLDVRDRLTGRTIKQVTLLRGTDYEIDELQGRLLLTRALAQVTRENVPTITRDTPLDGFEQRLLVDYEWLPVDFSADEMTVGLRGKHWFGKHVGVGVTAVDENRAGDDYSLLGADLTLQAGKGTYLKLEHSHTEATSAPVYFSQNGGLTFERLNPDGPREGDASAVEARTNLRELGWTQRDWTTAAWWRRVDDGYSVSRADTGLGIEEYGFEVDGQATQALGLYARYSHAMRGAESLTQSQVTAEWKLDDRSSVTAEVRRVDERGSAGASVGTLSAFKYTQRFSDALEVFGTAQLTVDDDQGRYKDNDAYSLGARYHFADQSNVNLELTTGDRGNGATVGGEYRLSSTHSLYGGYTYSTDTTEAPTLSTAQRQNGWTLGQRWRVSNQVNLFNESQLLHNRNESGLAHTFGLDFYPVVGWNLGATLSDGELTRRDGGQIERHAISLTGGHTSPKTDFQSKLEWRRDSGAEQRTQWVSTSHLAHKFNESFRIAARLNYSQTEDDLQPLTSAKFVETNLGFAYRPATNSRWALFGRHTTLTNVSTLGQVGEGEYDQKSHVLAFEGVYQLSDDWEIAAKVAQRTGQARAGRGAGQWFNSGADFLAAQVRYELGDKWHWLAEYRWLATKDSDARHGFLVGIDRDINRNFRVGAGYNFTEFSDDLTSFDNNKKGFFVNFTATY